MQRTYIKDLHEHIGAEVTLFGAVQTLRDQGGIKFIILRDITGTTQLVILKAHKDVFELTKELTTESIIKVVGLAKSEKQAPAGIEIEATLIEVLSKALPELPIPVTEKSGDETDQTKRFDWRWIDLKKAEKQTIFKVWTSLEQGFREVYHKNNFIQIYTPSIMSTASESGAEVFEIKYFERKAYLAQSPQFFKQMAMAGGLERVFIMGPVFRAEPSFTSRHMTEFTGWDFEMSYINSHYEIMDMEEDLIIAGFEKIKNDLGISIEVPTKPFPKLTMKEAKAKLEAAGVAGDRIFDISAEEERELSRIMKEETGHDFLFLVDWPIEGRPFYHMRHQDDPTLTKSFDLLYKGLEITTGAQREHRPEVLEKQALEKGMDLEPLQDYLNYFRYGCPPHGGVGIGPGRIVMKLLEQPSVKEVTFLPRDVKRIRP
jgi:nondiscriminating aspartyl-tRNA synthetase